MGKVLLSAEAVGGLSPADIYSISTDLSKQDQSIASQCSHLHLSLKPPGNEQEHLHMYNRLQRRVRKLAKLVSEDIHASPLDHRYFNDIGPLR